MENQASWGPALWNILHHCTERIGTIPSSSVEEVRLWTGFLRNLQYNLPCIKCRNHYKAYYQKNGPPSITKNTVRQWLYELHSDVNKRLGKMNVDYESLEQMYSTPIHFKQMVSIIKQHVEYAVRLKWSSYTGMDKFLKELDHFRQFYHLS